MSQNADAGPSPREAPRWWADAVRVGRLVAALVLRSDIALGYATIVLVVFTWVELTSDSSLVAHASTNLVNLRSHPVQVLFTSAFFVSAPPDLAALPVLVVVYAVMARRPSIPRMAVVAVAFGVPAADFLIACVGSH